MQQIITHFTDDDLYKFTMCCGEGNKYGDSDRLRWAF